MARGTFTFRGSLAEECSKCQRPQCLSCQPLSRHRLVLVARTQAELGFSMAARTSANFNHSTPGPWLEGRATTRAMPYQCGCGWKSAGGIEDLCGHLRGRRISCGFRGPAGCGRPVQDLFVGLGNPNFYFEGFCSWPSYLSSLPCEFSGGAALEIALQLSGSTRHCIYIAFGDGRACPCQCFC